MSNQSEARNEFLKECAAFVEKINVIDKQTPWSDSEPSWWLDMMAMRDAALTAIRIYPPSEKYKFSCLYQEN